MHCGEYTSLDGSHGTVKFQECIIVTPTASGAHYQGLLALSYSSASHTVESFEATHEAGPEHQLANSFDCGSVALTNGSRRWCYTPTVLIPRHGQLLTAHATVLGASGSARAESPAAPS